MAALPPIAQIARQHLSLYESYYRQVNPSGTAVIGAVEAALFLKKSNLKEGQLHQIWELSDVGGKGYLDKQGLFVALKLIALAQNNKDVSMSNLSLACSAPVLQIESPRILAQPPSNAKAWVVKAAEKQKYDTIFETLNPVNGYVSGDRLKPVLLNSKLPLDVLGRVWDMSDIDSDGMMDKDEFAVAMHLVYRALEGEAVPLSLPAKLIPPSKRSIVISSSAAKSAAFSNIDSISPTWVVSQTDKSISDSLFSKADTNNDGLVAGLEVRDILMASGVNQGVLAHIWNLCDMKGVGQLNAEQFALAMHLIKLNQTGVEPPSSLSIEMIPPSLRQTNKQDGDLDSLIVSQPNDFSAIKELDQITTDIESLTQEKATLQQQISQTEEAVRKAMSEIEDSKVNLEKATAATSVFRQSQLEAKQRLDECDKEKAKYDVMLEQVRQQCKDEEQATKSLRSQVAVQETSVKSQEEELATARKELNVLREEETSLERQLVTGKVQLEDLSKSLAIAKQEIAMSRSKVSRLSDENQNLSTQITQLTAMANATSTNAPSHSLFPLSSSNNGDLDSLPENSESSFTQHSDVDQISARATAGSSPVSSLSGFSVGSGRIDEESNDDFKDSDPFKSKSDPFGQSETESNDPFSSDDPFKADPFKSDDPFKSVTFADEAFSSDPFREKDMFASEDDKSQGSEDPFGEDPFKPSTSNRLPSSDGSSDLVVSSVADPFQTIDMFARDDFSTPQASAVSDPFMSDPFAPSPVTINNAASDIPNDSNPFGDPFSSTPTYSDTTKVGNDPFGNAATTDNNNSAWAAFDDTSNNQVQEQTESPPVNATEEEQIAWATKQSEKEERKRLKKAKQMSKKEEQAMAKALKASVKLASPPSKS